jgi:hypothetical protein
MFATSVPLGFVGYGVLPKKNAKSKVSKFDFRSTYEPDDPKRMFWKGALAGTLLTPVVVFLGGPHLVKTLNAMGFIINFG